MLKINLLLLFLFPVTPREDLKPHVLSYIETYKFLAIDEMCRSGIPASVILAQAIVETDAGQSQLARNSNNHFGIKCKDYWTGDTHFYPDDDRDAAGKIIPSCFRQYDSVEASYRDHSDFLRNTAHYQGLFGYGRTEYENWARGLSVCGYASDPRYADKLIHTIRLYHLDDLDYFTVKYVNKDDLVTDASGTWMKIRK